MKKLLLIEDDKSLATMYAKKLTDDGWQVTICHDGAEALREARESYYNGIVLDLMLPGLSGIDVLGLLRQEKKTAKVPIVVYTNYPDTYNRDKCLTYGADEFVLKVDATPSALSMVMARVTGEL